MGNKSSIALSEEAKNRLSEFGEHGETYEDIVWRLMEAAET
ncbi:DUF7557 family protein [Salinigranum halophilum]|nr:hypothetical protein [Salinigranum halophilum]